MICRVCSKELKKEDYTPGQWKYKKECMSKNGYVYCSKECSEVVMQKVRSETMSRTNKIYASERMRLNNPTFKKEVRDKISQKMKGRVPSQRCGNGSGLTEPQKLLMNGINKYAPIAEYAITTHKKRGSGYPQNYKVDIALLDYKIAIECDGATHHSHKRKDEDIKRDLLLNELGWKVVRFWNKEILENTQDCVLEIEKHIA